MRTSTYREIPYNFTSADDRLIIRRTRSGPGPDPVRVLRFPGQYFDAETGLVKEQLFERDFSLYYFHLQ